MPNPKLKWPPFPATAFRLQSLFYTLFYRTCDAASLIRPATSFGLEA